MTQSTKNIVLVHGGFVDGSGWESVYSLLKKDNYNVAIVQNPTISLAGDVATTKLAIHQQSGPVILVGHSYGGAVITEAGTDPQVVGLVYIAGFAPDKGESVNSLIKDPPPGAPVPQSCHRGTAIFFSTSLSFTLRLPATLKQTRLRSWRILKFPGVLRHSAVRSASRPGRSSQAGTYSRPKTE